MLTPFRIDIPQPRLDRLRQAVDAYDWDAFPDLTEAGDAWLAGASPGFLRRLCAYWTGGFDWRAQEAAVNRFPQAIAEVDGQRIHLLHERGSGVEFLARGRGVVDAADRDHRQRRAFRHETHDFRRAGA